MWLIRAWQCCEACAPVAATAQSRGEQWVGAWAVDQVACMAAGRPNACMCAHAHALPWPGVDCPGPGRRAPFSRQDASTPAHALPPQGRLTRRGDPAMVAEGAEDALHHSPQVLMASASSSYFGILRPDSNPVPGGAISEPGPTFPLDVVRVVQVRNNADLLTSSKSYMYDTGVGFGRIRAFTASVDCARLFRSVGRSWLVGPSRPTPYSMHCIYHDLCCDKSCLQA